jgi:predicted DNA-binding transcriptional regulator AlpA
VSELLAKLQVVKDPQMPDLLGVSDRTWERMKERGDHPPKIQISERRIGYRVGDIGEWLDAKRRVAGSWQQIGDVACAVASAIETRRRK